MNKIQRMKKLCQLATKFRQLGKGQGQYIKIFQVGPRDGLQNQKQIMKLQEKKQLIDKLSLVGFQAIEVGSFVSPKWVPQMANSKELFTMINKNKKISYPCLVPNLKGMQNAIEVGVEEIAIFASATETFSQKNLNCSIDQSLQKFKQVVQAAKNNNIRVRGYVSMVLGCPYEGDVHPNQVKKVTKKLFDLGCYEVSLGDTIGKGTPQKVQLLLNYLQQFPIQKLAVHFHDTYDNAIQNILIALKMGCRVVDCSIGGLGGCPYSMKPVGNVCTDNVAYVLDKAGFKTGLDLQQLKNISDWICELLKRPNLSIL